MPEQVEKSDNYPLISVQTGQNSELRVFSKFSSILEFRLYIETQAICVHWQMRRNEGICKHMSASEALFTFKFSIFFVPYSLGYGVRPR